MHSNINTFMCSSEGGENGFNDFIFGIFTGRFQSDGEASMAVKGLTRSSSIMTVMTVDCRTLTSRV